MTNITTYLSIDAIYEEIERSSANLTTNYQIFEQYIENAKFTDIDEALWHLYLNDMLDGCIV